MSKFQQPASGNSGRTARILAVRQKAWVQFERGAAEAAITELKLLVQKFPAEYDPRNDLANIYLKCGCLTDALAEYHALVERFPDRMDAAHNLAVVLSSLGHHTLAFQLFSRVLQAEPQNTEALHNFALLLKLLGNWEGARDTYVAALAIKPDSAKLRMEYGMTLLALGEWKAGWAEYEHRRNVPGLHLQDEVLDSPHWDGVTSLAGRTVLVAYEQGLGDAIMCARFAAELAARGAIVSVRCPSSLVSLIATAPGVAACTPLGSPVPVHDFHVLPMSLPLLLKVTPSSLSGTPYLRVGNNYPTIDALVPRDQTPTVALTWAGNPKHSNDRRRSIPGELLGEVINTRGVRFVAMQKVPSVAQVLPLSLSSRITDLSTVCPDFASSAYALSRVDLLVSVDTAVAHLAGAIGTTTLLCLAFKPDFRWGLEGTITPWYNNMSIVRQDRDLDWSSVLVQVQQRVARLAQ